MREIRDVRHTGDYSPELQHVDDELEAVADYEDTDDDEEDCPHHHLSLLPLAQIVEPLVPSSSIRLRSVLIKILSVL